MPLLKVRMMKDTVLELPNPEEGLLRWNHVFEPEFHQDLYVDACKKASSSPGAYQLGDAAILEVPIHRGVQPSYADNEEEPDSLEFEGMVLSDGTSLDSGGGTRNVCALKSIAIRWGFLDFDSARSVTRSFFDDKKERAGVEKNDILINSTGDGTIGRVAIFNKDFPALVDGHLSVVRLLDKELAWYVAAYLLSDEGQRQIYRYINGSSGQVEIYPQDLSRIWIPAAPKKKQKAVADKFRLACERHDQFFSDLKIALSML